MFENERIDYFQFLVIFGDKFEIFLRYVADGDWLKNKG